MIAETLLPGFMSTLDAIIRRQIVAVAERVWSPDEERVAVTLPRTVGFADLVDYTIVSGSLSAGQLADVLMAFDERTAQIVTGGGGQVVKTIGDEVLFVTEDAAQACAIALALVGAFGRDGLPPVQRRACEGDRGVGPRRRLRTRRQPGGASRRPRPSPPLWSLPRPWPKRLHVPSPSRPSRP